MTRVLHLLTEEDENIVVSALHYYYNTVGREDRRAKRLLNLMSDPTYNVLSLDRETLYEQLGEEVEITDEQLEELAYFIQDDIIEVGDFERLVKENYKYLSKPDSDNSNDSDQDWADVITNTGLPSEAPRMPICEDSTNFNEKSNESGKDE